jgi:N6-adenosine-specific RNA methylase IME4
VPTQPTACPQSKQLSLRRWLTYMQLARAVHQRGGQLPAPPPNRLFIYASYFIQRAVPAGELGLVLRRARPRVALEPRPTEAMTEVLALVDDETQIFDALIADGQRALAKAKTVWDARGVRERAAATRDVVSRARRLSKSQGVRNGVLDAELNAAELWIDAYRLEGVLLIALQEAGERDVAGGDRKSSSRTVTMIPTNAELGYSHNMEVARAVGVSRVPESVVVTYKAKQREKRDPCTMAGLLRYWADWQKRGAAIDVPLPVGTFRTLVLDPPWPMDKLARVESPQQGSRLDYPTMTLEEIEALPIKSRSAPDTQLYLWVTQRFLPVGLDLVKAWGFTYHCLLTWLKPGGFAPFSWMFNTEHVIFAYRGNFELRELGLKIGFQADRGAHSEKPDAFYQLVERASFEPRLELFARRERPGWSVWGDEV